MIELAIYDHLRNSELNIIADPVRQAARRQFVHLAGNVVYLDRIPEDIGPVPVGVCMRRVDGGEQYQVLGEHVFAQPIIEFLIVGTDPYAKAVLEVAEQVRLIFTGYRGPLGEHYIAGATVESSLSWIPRVYGDGSDRWVHGYSLSFQLTVSQAVPAY